MPRQTPAVSDERLIAELETLSPNIKITEKQAALILGISAETLRWKRRQQDQKIKEVAQGKAVPELDLMPVDQVASRHRVRYKLGDVRRAVNKQVHVGQTNRDIAIRALQDGWMGFGSWLANANQSETWTFTVVDGVPIDFATSLVLADESDWEEDAEQIEQLTLPEYLSLRLQAANRATASNEAHDISQRTPEPAAKARICSRCGKAHGCHCRL